MRKIRRGAKPKPLYYGRILGWADQHYASAGQWPRRDSGTVRDAPSETWQRIDTALKDGLRGLRPDSSLALLLFERRGVRHKKQLPRLTLDLILRWADAYYNRTGRWPIVKSGPVRGVPGETWSAISRALWVGGRGLAASSDVRTLAQLLDRRRGARNRLVQPPLSLAQILDWADAHRRRTGRWPNRDSGSIPQSDGETWSGIARAIYMRIRGLPAELGRRRRYTLAQLLVDQRAARHRLDLPRLTKRQILEWADDHYRRTGQWPKQVSGPVVAAPGETWAGVAGAMRGGRRGLRNRTSLRRLLHEQRDVLLKSASPRLSVPQIVGWARAHQRRTGQWPTSKGGSIEEQPGENWATINGALEKGRRGLPGGSSLAQVLDQHCGVRNPQRPGRLTVTQILRWADAYHQRTGRWPSNTSGPVQDAPGETWGALNASLERARRGLPAPGCSLRQLLQAKRGARNRAALPRLTEQQILKWADRHFARTGKWPRLSSAALPEAPGETWRDIHRALHLGLRGLPRGGTLMELLYRERGARHPKGLPPLSIAQVLSWARRHRQRTGAWPSASSGPIVGTDGETWAGIDRALLRGRRELPDGLTLRRLIEPMAGR